MIETGAKRGRNVKQSEKDHANELKKRLQYNAKLNAIHTENQKKNGIPMRAEKHTFDSDKYARSQKARAEHPRFAVVQDAQAMSKAIYNKERQTKAACNGLGKSHIPLTSTKRGVVKGGDCVDYTLSNKVKDRKQKVPYVNRNAKLRQATPKQMKYWSELISNFDRKTIPVERWNKIVKKFATGLSKKQEYRG